MKICIDEAKCRSDGLEYTEVLMALVVKSGVNIYELVNEMLNKEILVDTDEGFRITQGWDDRIMNVILNSEQDDLKTYEERIVNLAKKLMEIFPKGKKEGTNAYWKGNLKDNSLKLKKFFKLYGNYTDEQILDAADYYVKSFNGNYRYMRVLKYFIWKDERKMNAEGTGYIEGVSELASILENKGEEPDYSDDWTTNIV